MASPISSHAGFSTTSDDEVEWCLVECTVCTGFEKVAREEAMEVLCVEDVQVGQGNIVIPMPMKETPKVNPKSVSGQSGLKSGDGIIEICGENVQGWSHERAKAAMVRAGNEIDFVVQRGVVKPRPPKSKAAAPAPEPRSELCEDSIDPGMNVGSKFRDVTPKTYQVMKEEEQTGDSPPASIFNRKKQERYSYLKEDKKTIQKAFGQT